MEKILQRVIDNNRNLYKYGKVADYIPALKNANIKDCGISIIDKDKNIFSAGDYNKKFTIQSISKIIALMQAILDIGIEEVFKKVGYEGSEKPFNTISYLGENKTEKAINPMINSGAIAITSLIKGEGDEKFNKILNLVRTLASNPNIDYDRDVYISEKNTGDRNRAIAYLMKSKNIIGGDVESILDNYFKQCSINIDTIDLANIGLSIANRFKDIEINADIDKKKISSLLIAIMTHSGMYNFSGQWSVEVGIPSKSGVAGGILSVVPDKYGIGFFGPSLDKNGNSLLGHSVLKELSKELNLNLF
ncbi:glutaminase A [Tissierella creatinophila]|uniref:Glutaminase n=1 Tax=Tissierella creatinophila DSM 6911 TaxID=1123403 RepID=A0A1U7M663_TISCR|nr:glutaminase A [Tissierella creatinophila]OLS02812.1 glutaminase [Tissierella creatinophila DSM 6911]